MVMDHWMDLFTDWLEGRGIIEYLLKKYIDDINLILEDP